MRETRSSNTLSSPLMRADTELAFASLLGLGPGRRSGVPSSHQVRAGVALGLLLALALVLALVSLDAVL